MDFKKYRDRLIQYANSNGLNVSSNSNIRCFLPSHGSDDHNCSMNFKDETWKCYKCDDGGDIYDLAGFFNSTKNKGEQFNIISKFFGDNIIPFENKKEDTFDKEANDIVTDYMRVMASENKSKIIDFGKYRGYSEDFANYLGYWPGLDKAIKDLGEDILKRAKIPMPYEDGKKGTSFKPTGFIIRYEQGWKLLYKRGNKTVKRASWDAQVFPMTFSKDATDAVLVEAEISVIAGKLNNIDLISTGGINGIKKDQYMLLHKYESVTILFDADDDGREGALSVASKLIESGYKNPVKIARLIEKDYAPKTDPDDYMKNGDVEELKEIIKNAVPFTKKEKTEEDEEEIKEEDYPFKFLGFTEHHHYFFDRKHTITKIPAGKITSGQLLELADLEFWKDIKMNNQGQPEWIYIVDRVIGLSILKGPYKKESIRGTGIWEDNKKIIVSDGKNIICDNETIAIKKFKSKYTYIRRPEVGIKSIKNETAKTDFDFLSWTNNELSFSTEQDGKLLYGWCIASLFLSTIKWRPVAYMKGPSSVGKSWVMNNVVREILGDSAICPKKNSTVIGVMQAPGYDSKMTTVDELESGHDVKTKDLVRGLMTLARDTTTNSKESRYVGTQDQEGMSNDFSSMFLFASIVESSEEDQDVNRITPINFYPKKQDNWSELEAKIITEFRYGLGERIRHNAIYYRESIVKNIFLFQKVAGSIATKQRNGDQLGTMIAGWFHIENPGVIATEDEAKDYIKTFDFSEQNERSKGEMIKNILSSILSFKIRYEEEMIISNQYETKEQIKTRERPVFDIIQELEDIRQANTCDVSRHYLNKALMAYGLRYGTRKNPDKFIIAQGHEKIRNMLPKEFSYRGNYHGYFIHHEDFIEKEKAVKFKGVNHQGLVFKVDLNEELSLKEEHGIDDNIPF